MNELYKVLLNILEIVKANNIFLVSVEKRLDAIEKSLTFEPPQSEPIASGTDNNNEGVGGII